ncbi:hypothetical protein DXG01_008769 [Tephrocybe rancida]|nr:hypothetical protein DXG01_008769 [Tephrocybe rancida]
MAEPLDDFFSEDWLANSEFRDEAIVIHDYLARNMTVQTAAQHLAQSLQTPSRNAQWHSDIAAILDNVIVCLAEELPETHDALVSLLGAVKPQSDTKHFESGLGYSLGERALYVDPDIRLAHRQEHREIWFNLNHFAALVYKENVQDLSYFGCGTLWKAFKRGGWHVGWDVPGSHFPAAAHWIMLCGQKLYNESSEAKGKWADWEGDLDWVLGNDALDETIRLQCKETLAEMRRISAA